MGEDPLSIHHSTEIERVRKLRQVHEHVVLGLEYADAGYRSPVDGGASLLVNLVVRLVLPGEDRANLGRTVEPGALSDWDPAGDVVVPLVENDKGACHLGRVLEDRLRHA